MNSTTTKAEAGQRAFQVLHQIVAQQNNWKKIHAAEALIAVGDGAAIRAAFVRDEAAADKSEYRIGAWRVRARTAESEAERAQWIGRIEAVYRDPSSPDRLDAIETLCKLHFAVSGPDRSMMWRLTNELSESDALFAWWALAVAGQPGALEHISLKLRSSDPGVRSRAAYALRWLHPQTPAILANLTTAADQEPSGTEAYPYLLSAAFTLNANPAHRASWKQKLEEIMRGSNSDARFEAAQALMLQSTPADIPRWAALLDDPDPDTRTAAAWAILYIERSLSPTSAVR